MGLRKEALKLFVQRAIPLVHDLRGNSGLHVVCLGKPRVVCSGDDSETEFDPDAFFRCLGFEHISYWDYSDYQGANVHVDLNRPLGSEFREVADLVLDPGTLEHCFCIGQALANAANALKVGGVAFHTAPLNVINHGFYNLCPCFYHDAYKGNGYDNVQVYRRKWAGEMVPIPDNPNPRFLESVEHQLLHAIARKTRSAPFQVPMQRRYAEGFWTQGKT